MCLTSSAWKHPRRIDGPNNIISQNVLIKGFRYSHFTRKFVNLFFTIFLLQNEVDGFVGELTLEKPFNQYVV